MCCHKAGYLPICTRNSFMAELHHSSIGWVFILYLTYILSHITHKMSTPYAQLIQSSPPVVKSIPSMQSRSPPTYSLSVRMLYPTNEDAIHTKHIPSSFSLSQIISCVVNILLQHLHLLIQHHFTTIRNIKPSESMACTITLNHIHFLR